MIRTDESVDDLIALARRGDLPEGDERRLRETLAGNDDARELYEAGAAFDAEAPVRADDGARIDRLVRGVEKRLRAARPPSRSQWVARACLAVAMLTGAAVGAVELTGSRAPATTPKPVPSPTVDTAPPTGGRHTSRVRAGAGSPDETQPEAVIPPTVEPAVVPSEIPPAPPVAPPPVTPPPTPRTRTSRSVDKVAATTPPAPDQPQVPEEVALPVAAPPTASELFAAANRARVDADLTEAIRLSRALLDGYPTSAEASIAHVSLGLMYLQVQQPALALDEFRARGVPSSAETGWGESQALRALGRTAEERAALEQLLARYPSSAYAGAARKRLDDLP